MSGLPLTIFVKKTAELTQWFKNLSLNGGEKVDFLAVASNNDKNEVQNVVVKINIPDEVVSIASLKVNNSSYSGNIRDGINIGTLAPKEVKTITFQGEVAESFSRNEADVVGTIGAQNIPLASSGSMKIAFEESRAGLTASAGIFKTLFSRGYVLPLLITIVILILIGRMVYVWFLKK
jgi:hypothetical protein